MGSIIAMMEGAEATGVDRIALVEGHEQITYRELSHKIKAVSQGLRLNIDQVCGIVIDQTITSVLLLLSLWEAGYTVLPVDDLQTASELDRIHDICPIAIWIVPSEKEAVYGQCKKTGEIYSYEDLLKESRKTLSSRRNIGLMPMVYQLTSGTTGLAKIACLPLEMVLREGNSYRQWFGYSPLDTVIATVPLNYLYGLTGALMASLQSGSTLVICRRPSPRKVCHLFRDLKATILIGVPQFYQLMCDSHQIDLGDLYHMRFGISAGGLLSAQLSQTYLQKTQHRILQLYGSTETGAIAAHHPNIRNTLYSSGFILSGVSARLSDSNQLAVSSPSKFHGYLTSEGTENPIMDGWLWTDDLAEIRDRQIYITGRRTRFINVAGRKVNPGEVEAVIRQIPHISDVKVSPRTDHLHGEIIVAEIVTSNTQSLKEIKTYLKRHLAEYKIPHIIQLVDQIKKGWKQTYIHLNEDEVDGEGG